MTSILGPGGDALGCAQRGRLRVHVRYVRISGSGRYAFTRPPAPGLRQLRDPDSDDETDDGEDCPLPGDIDGASPER
jgi:hypothetical protein